MSDKQISEALGLREVSNTEIESNTSIEEVAKTKNEIIRKESKTLASIDSDQAIDNVKELIDQSKDVLSQLVAVAKSSETARIFEVFATLLKTSSDLNKDLLELHQTKQVLDPKDEEPEEDENEEKTLTLTTARFQQLLKENEEDER